MKYLIVPTQHFSGGVKSKKDPEFNDLPSTVKAFIRANEDVFIGLDESSFIKTNTPKEEKDKSQRSRLIKLLTKFAGSRAIMTGTLKTKSPINLIDQFNFLKDGFFNENIYAFAERYIIMINLAAARGRRVQISQKDYDKIRNRMKNAWKMGGQHQLDYSMMKIINEYGTTMEKLEHIISHKDYTPFLHQEELLKRIAPYTMTIRRSDVFDISFDEYIYNPISRPVDLPVKAKRIGNELTNLGFSDKIVLGKAPGLELSHRLKDICNGFEPIEELTEVDGKEVRTVRFEPFTENPKLDALSDLLEEIGTEDNQVVIWCYRTNAFNSISSLLERDGITFARYSGSETNKEKDESEARFQSGEARVFLANQDSAGFGLNCLKKCNYAIWYSIGDSYEKHYQAMHRLLRGESTSPKFAYQIYVRGSIEERNIKALAANEELMTDANTRDKFLFE